MGNAAGQKQELKQGRLATFLRWLNKQDALDQCVATANGIGFHDDSILRNKVIDLMAEAGYSFESSGLHGDYLDKNCYSS